MVMPRPSQVGWAALNATEPVSRVGMYGLSSGVLGAGAGHRGRGAVPVCAVSGFGQGDRLVEVHGEDRGGRGQLVAPAVGTLART